MHFTQIVASCLLLSLGSGLLLGAKHRTVVPKKRQALDQIIIPVVALDNRTIREAVDFAWSRAVELDNLHLNSEEKGVSISVRYPARLYPAARYMQKQPEDFDEMKISYRARQITLTALLIEIAKRAGFDLYTTSVGVVFCPPNTEPFPNSFAREGEIWEVLFKEKADDENEEEGGSQNK